MVPFVIGLALFAVILTVFMRAVFDTWKQVFLAWIVLGGLGTSAVLILYGLFRMTFK